MIRDVVDKTAAGKTAATRIIRKTPMITWASLDNRRKDLSHKKNKRRGNSKDAAKGVAKKATQPTTATQDGQRNHPNQNQLTKNSEKRRIPNLT